MSKPNFGSMVKEAERHMTRGMKPTKPMMESQAMKDMKRKMLSKKGGKKGRSGMAKIRGYADPLD